MHRIARFFLATLGVLPFVSLKVGGQELGKRPTTWSRDSITAKLADLRKIHTPEGIEALEQIDVGGTKQWISIRGLNKANPAAHDPRRPRQSRDGDELGVSEAVGGFLHCRPVGSAWDGEELRHN